MAHDGVAGVMFIKVTFDGFGDDHGNLLTAMRSVFLGNRHPEILRFLAAGVLIWVKVAIDSGSTDSAHRVGRI